MLLGKGSQKKVEWAFMNRKNRQVEQAGWFANLLPGQTISHGICSKETR